MKAGVIVFPGTNCDRDTLEACQEFGWDAKYVWHSETSLDKFDVIFLPGGFSYGDYVRSGALAKFSPVIRAVKDYIENKRGFVVGICNGFQILCESGILPGALTHNEGLKFICKDVELILNEGKRKKEKGKRAENYQLPCHCEERGTSDAAIQGINEENDDWIASHFTPHSSRLTLPIAHAEGRYVADEKTIQELKEKDMIFLTYKDNPNGSVENIAGLYDKERRIIGMMPHPERAFFKELENEDGKEIFKIIGKGLI